MKFCPECGCKLEDDVLFCGECGCRQPVEEVLPVAQEVIPEPVVEIVPEPIEEEPTVIAVIDPEPVEEEIPAVMEAVEVPAERFCTECGSVNAAEDRFCQNCGFDMDAPVQQKLFCSQCGQENEPGDKFCMNCAAPLEAAPEKNEFEVKAKEAAEKAGKAAKKAAKGAKELANKSAKSAKKLVKKAGKNAKKLPKGVLMGAGAAVVIGVVMLILAVCGVFSGGNKGPAFAMYLKDNEIFYSDLSKKAPMQITDRLLDNMDVSDGDLAGSSYVLGEYSALARGGKRVFFPDRLDEDSEGMTIYYRDLGKKKEAQKLDSEIFMYAVNEKGTEVIYLKGEDGKLYRSDLKDKEKLDSDVDDCFVSEDLNKVLYKTTDGDLYIRVGKKDKEKIASDVEEIFFVSDNLQVVLYRKDGDLYRQKVGADREKIASNVGRVCRAYESGEFYYTTAEEVRVNLWDYVVDDMASVDAGMAEPGAIEYPEYPSKPRSRDYDSTEEYNAALEDYKKAIEEYGTVCAELEEAYEKAWQEYQAKRDRDSVREYLDNFEDTTWKYAMYFFDGKESQLVMNDVSGNWVDSGAFEKPVVTFSGCGDISTEKMKLSEMNGDGYSAFSAYQTQRSENMHTYVAVGGICIRPEGEDLLDVTVSRDGKRVIYMADYNERKKEASLYTAAIKGDGLGEPKLVAEDVYAHYYQQTADGKLVYFTDVNDRKMEGDLYVDGKEVDYDVYIYSVAYNEEMDALFYMLDYDDDKGGTMMMLTGRKPKKVADEVYAYDVAGGEMFYMTDYSQRKYSGELYLVGGKNRLLDEDVMALLNPNTEPGVGCGGYNFW